MTCEAFANETQVLSPGFGSARSRSRERNVPLLFSFRQPLRWPAAREGQDMEGPTPGAPRRRVRLDDLRPTISP